MSKFFRVTTFLHEWEDWLEDGFNETYSSVTETAYNAARKTVANRITNLVTFHLTYIIETGEYNSDLPDITLDHIAKFEMELIGWMIEEQYIGNTIKTDSSGGIDGANSDHKAWDPNGIIEMMPAVCKLHLNASNISKIWNDGIETFDPITPEEFVKYSRLFPGLIIPTSAVGTSIVANDSDVVPGSSLTNALDNLSVEQGSNLTNPTLINQGLETQFDANASVNLRLDNVEQSGGVVRPLQLKVGKDADQLNISNEEEILNNKVADIDLSDGWNLYINESEWALQATSITGIGGNATRLFMFDNSLDLFIEIDPSNPIIVIGAWVLPFDNTPVVQGVGGIANTIKINMSGSEGGGTPKVWVVDLTSLSAGSSIASPGTGSFTRQSSPTDLYIGTGGISTRIFAITNNTVSIPANNQRLVELNNTNESILNDWPISDSMKAALLNNDEIAQGCGGSKIDNRLFVGSSTNILFEIKVDDLPASGIKLDDTGVIIYDTMVQQEFNGIGGINDRLFAVSQADNKGYAWLEALQYTIPDDEKWPQDTQFFSKYDYTVQVTQNNVIAFYSLYLNEINPANLLDSGKTQIPEKDTDWPISEDSIILIKGEDVDTGDRLILTMQPDPAGPNGDVSIIGKSTNNYDLIVVQSPGQRLLASKVENDSSIPGVSVKEGLENLNISEIGERKLFFEDKGATFIDTLGNTWKKETESAGGDNNLSKAIVVASGKVYNIANQSTFAPNLASKAPVGYSANDFVGLDIAFEYSGGEEWTERIIGNLNRGGAFTNIFMRIAVGEAPNDGSFSITIDNILDIRGGGDLIVTSILYAKREFVYLNQGILIYNNKKEKK